MISCEASFCDVLDVLGNFIHTSSFSSFAFCCSWTLPTGKTVLAHDWQTSPLCRIKHLLFKNSYTEWHPFYLFRCSIVCFVWFFFKMVADFCYERAMLTVMRSEVLDRLFYWVKYRRGIVQGLILLITSQREPQTWNKSVTFQAKKKDSTRWPNWLSLHSPCHLKALGGTKRERGQREKPVIPDERLILLCRLDVEYF